MSENDPADHDDMLIYMLKECKTLPVFLEHIFGFLHRRTDFYHTATDPNSPIGLPKGLAEHLVKAAYLKWKPANEDETTILQENEIPPVFLEETVIAEEVVCEEIADSIENLNLEATKDNATECKFTKSESYNGAVYENYCWSQSILDVDITIKVPANISAKDLDVTISPQKISVRTNNEVLLDGELCNKCKHNDAIWSLDNSRLQIHLDKCKEIWWNCLITSEDRIELSNIDCTRPFEELPEDAQAKIEELGWNQERKRLGLPTSDELAKQEMLRKAWSVDGSPFSGPFDPSQVVFH